MKAPRGRHDPNTGLCLSSLLQGATRGWDRLSLPKKPESRKTEGERREGMEDRFVERSLPSLPQESWVPFLSCLHRSVLHSQWLKMMGKSQA